jgi:hypothetical protein
MTNLYKPVQKQLGKLVNLATVRNYITHIFSSKLRILLIIGKNIVKYKDNKMLIE